MLPVTPRHQSILSYARETHPVQFSTIITLFISFELATIGFFAIHGYSATSIAAVTLKNTLYSLPIIFLWIQYLRVRREHSFLERFALLNGYTFNEDGVVNEAYGSLFRVPGQQRIRDLVSGVYNDHSLHIFLYQLTIGSGRTRRILATTVFEIELTTPIPPLLLLHKTSAFLGSDGLQQAFGTSNSISLEGNFNDHFTLYAFPGTQITALQIFSPDTMALLLDATHPFSVEFAGNHIYLYANGYVSDGSVIDKAFTLAKQLASHLNPVAERMNQFSPVTSSPIALDTGWHPSVTPGTKIIFIVSMLFVLYHFGAVHFAFKLRG